MWKVVQILQSFVQFVKRIFNAEMPMVSGEVHNDGTSKLPADIAAPSFYVGGAGYMKGREVHVPKAKRVMHHAPRAKLDLHKAKEIRRLFCKGWTVKELALYHQVCGETIRKTLAGKSWQRDLKPLCPTRLKQCYVCCDNIPDRVDGVRIHPRKWERLRFCSEECAEIEWKGQRGLL